MKKLLIAICCITGFTGLAAAQTARKKAPAAVKMEKPAASTVTAESKRSLKKETGGSALLEKNAGREIATGPLKKDGSTNRRLIKAKKKKG